jgi:hypothetical protein
LHIIRYTCIVLFLLGEIVPKKINFVAKGPEANNCSNYNFLRMYFTID